jgi:hypothetical protein
MRMSWARWNIDGMRRVCGTGGGWQESILRRPVAPARSAAMIDSPRRRLLHGGLVAAGVAVALLPWWRNRDYLRDLYDYGLVIAANGRLAGGEQPYVDFTTPIQAGFLVLGRLAEQLGGGTFLGMTWAAAALTLMAVMTLAWLFARRWPLAPSVLLATVIAVAAPAQHTILWHNSLGVVWLALVAGAAAIAPVWNRVEWRGALLVAGGLLLGGVNKLNFQLVALAVAMAWAVRAGLVGRASWRAVGLTLCGVLFAGLVLPVAIELAWTGSSLALWRYNVVELAVNSRAAGLRELASAQFLWRPMHDYYGPLLVPQVGALGLVMSGAAGFACRPREAAGLARRDRVLVPVAAALSAVAGGMLLATNQEIAWVGLAAWLALVASLWLGFGGDMRAPRSAAMLLLPAAVLGIAAWVSAWQGQRSQFGYSPAARAAYRPATEAGETFGYLRGMKLPPETVESLGLVRTWMPPAGETGRHPVFYGTGCEWLGRFFPAPVHGSAPLWVHWDTSYGPRETEWLKQTLAHDPRYQAILTTLARDAWPVGLDWVLREKFDRSLLGPVMVRWVRRNESAPALADSIALLNELGGNVAAAGLHFGETPLRILATKTAGALLGTRAGEGQARIWSPTFRLGGEAVLERMPGAVDGVLRAEFRVVRHGAIPEDVRWSATVEVPAGQMAATVPFQLDGHGHSLLLAVRVPDERLGQVAAGYRNLQITHSGESDSGAPRLRAGAAPDVDLSSMASDGLWGSLAWRPRQLVVRGGEATAQGIALRAGGELWFHTDGMTGEVRGRITARGAGRDLPTVRVVWSKGARLQVMRQGAVPEEGFDFHAWTAEPGGWIGVLVDPGTVPVPTVVRLESANLQP